MAKELSPMAKIYRLAEAYRDMPFKGARLTVSEDGATGNGIVIVAKFETAALASRALRTAGFQRFNGYWKLK